MTGNARQTNHDPELGLMAEVNTLPDETPASTLDEVREAIRNT